MDDEQQEKKVKLTLKLQPANTRLIISRHVRKGILLAIVVVVLALWLLANYHGRYR